jgi:hypothetical protein
MKSLVLSLLALAAFSADKPAFTDPALATYTKSIEDIDLNAIKAKREARNKAVVALEVAIKKAMAASDLDKAVFLKGEKERISKEWVPSDAEMIGEKPVKLEDAIVGKWNKPGSNLFIIFSSDGKFSCNFSLNMGKWSIKNKAIVCISTVNNGNTNFNISGKYLVEDNKNWEKE